MSPDPRRRTAPLRASGAARTPAPDRLPLQARAFDAVVAASSLPTPLPAGPGVYRWLDAAGAVLYIGRAKSLRRRLAQYRAAGRGRAHAKLRRIVRASARLTLELHPTFLDAALAEVRLIQALRPPLNVASAYPFLYPVIGLSPRPDHLRLALTTHPDRLPTYALHGAYRARALTRAAFFALQRLLPHIAHPVPRRRLDDDAHPHASLSGWRRLDPAWHERLTLWLRGEDPSLLEHLALALLDRPAARAHAADVQRDLRMLRRFFRDEAAPLRAAIRASAYPHWPVPQLEREPLALRHRVLHPADARPTRRRRRRRPPAPAP